MKMIEQKDRYHKYRGLPICMVVMMVFCSFSTMLVNGKSDIDSDSINGWHQWLDARSGREGPASPRAGGVWEDGFNDLTRTNYTGKGLYIAGGNVTVGLESFQFEADKSTVLLYHFNDGCGTTAKDSGPNRLDQTLTNMDSTTDWVAGIDGTALDFDGDNDYTIAPASGVYNVANVTVEAWIYQRSVTSPSLNMFITCKRGGYFLMDRCFTIDTPSVVWAQEMNNPLNVWTYVAGTFDGTAVKFYRNGAQMATKNSAKPIVHDTAGFQIGGQGSGPGYPFDGMIDEVRVSHSARSAKEINDTFLQYDYVKDGNLVRATSLISKKISVPSGNYWDRFAAVDSCPAGTRMNYTILDGLTGQPVPGFENLTDTDIDLSGVNPVAHPTINLRANFKTNYKLAPSLDYWNVSWKPNSKPEITNVSIPGQVMRTASISLNVASLDANQPASTLGFTVESRYNVDTQWSADLFTDVSFNLGSWTALFVPDAATKLGPYHLRITLTDEMGASCVRTVDNATFVFSEKTVSADILQKGIGIYRGGSQAMTLDIRMDGPPSEMAVSVTLLDRTGAECAWLEPPILSGGQWTLTVEPPLDATEGWYRARILVTNNYFQEIDTEIRNAVNVLNNPPAWTSSEPITVNEDTPGTIQLGDRLSDLETPVSELYLKLISANTSGKATLSTEGTSLIIKTLAPDWAGTIPLRLQVSDGIDATETDLVLIVAEVPDAPRIAEIGDMRASEDTALDYTFSANDPDPDSQIYYSLDLGGLKSKIEYFKGYSFDILSGRLILPLSNDMVGEYACVLTVSDGTFNSTMPFRLVVVNVNDPPFWVNVPANSTTVAGAEYFFDVNALDIDVGDFLDYSISSVPSSNLSIDKATGIVQWVPGQQRNYTVTVSVSDRIATVTHSFRLEVLRANHPPRLTRFSPGQSGVSIELGQTADFKVEPKDDDGDILEYRWSIDGFSKSRGKNFAFKPVATGSYVISVDISDGRSTIVQEWNVTVNEPSNQLLASAVWMVPVIAIVIVAVVATAVVMSRRNRKPAQPGPSAAPVADSSQGADLLPSEPTPASSKMQVVGRVNARDLEEPEDGPEKELPEEPEKMDRVKGPTSETEADRRVEPPVAEKPKTAPPPEPVVDPRLGILKPLPNPFRSESEALKILSSLPRGMPASLNRYGIEELAEILQKAHFSETSDEDIVVKIGSKLYHGDTRAMTTFLQHINK